MTTWHWIRHGPTHEKTFVGWRDVPADLSDRQQIARLHAHLPQEALLISSDLIRSVATADALDHPDRRRLDHAPDLRELHFGAWDGMHFSDVAARDPELSRAYWETPGDIAAHPDKHIISVAHFGVILTQVQRALNLSAQEAMRHKIDNLSVTSLTHRDGLWEVAHINHLP